MVGANGLTTMLLASVIRAVLADLGLNAQQRSEAPAIVRRHLPALAG